jgi:hypothetical protein
VVAASAAAAELSEEDDDVFHVPSSPAQRIIAREKSKWERLKSRKTLKRSPSRMTRKTLDDQVWSSF